MLNWTGLRMTKGIFLGMLKNQRGNNWAEKYLLDLFPAPQTMSHLCFLLQSCNNDIYQENTGWLNHLKNSLLTLFSWSDIQHLVADCVSGMWASGDINLKAFKKYNHSYFLLSSYCSAACSWLETLNKLFMYLWFAWTDTVFIHTHDAGITAFTAGTLEGRVADIQEKQHHIHLR